eukprot:COSAG01_NODE_9990_length_2281_cov_4.881302_1_plen_732_part_10
MSPLLLVRAVALSLTSAAAPPPLCPAGSTAVGTAPQLYACVLRSTGRLTRIGGSTSSGESGARTQGKAGSTFVADVDGGSSVDGCTEVPGSLVVRAAQGGGDDYGDSSSTPLPLPLLRATRQLSCGPDPVWHPESSRHRVTVTDTFFAVNPPVGDGGGQLFSLGWNVSFASGGDVEMWTAPLTSALVLANRSAIPRVWVGGPSKAKSALSATFSPLDPTELGDCDRSEKVCSTRPQPCPRHPGHHFCASNATAGQCDVPPVARCPPCPPSPAGTHADECKYWYGGALTDLQWHQHLVDTRQQGKELLDSPSMALPIATLVDHHSAAGLSFLQSPLDHPVSMTLRTAPSGLGGSLRFSRQYHRLGGGAAAVAFSQAILLHEDCFRPALKWYDESYPQVLRVSAHVDRELVDGGASSINYRGDYVSVAAAAMAAKSQLRVVNDLSLFEPFHGTWGPYPGILPPNVSSWVTCMPSSSSFSGSGPPPMPPRGGAAEQADHKAPSCWNPSYEQIKSWYKRYPQWAGRAKPFTYTNWFEFGWYSCPTCPPGGWNCSAFSLADVSLNVSGRSVGEVNASLACFSKHIISALNLSHNQLVNPATLQPLVPPGCVGFSSVFDPGAEPYKTHLLNQLSAIMEHLSEYAGGIVIDRWDFAGLTNPRADDGVSAYVHPPGVTRAKALRSTSISLQEFMVAASAIVHEKYHRAISINDHTYRVDLLDRGWIATRTSVTHHTYIHT